jgi:orotate phosphoribosyltransferase
MSSLTDSQERFLDYALRCGALKFGEFELKSGRTSPWFFNMGEFFSNAYGLQVIGDAYAEKIHSFIGPSQYLIGPADKGNQISQAVAEGLLRKNGENAPGIIFDRKTPKDHGEATDKENYWNKWFYGAKPEEGDNLFMVDDVLTTAKTKVELIEKLSEYGDFNYRALVIGVDRQEVTDKGYSAVRDFEEKYMPVFSIVDAYDVYTYVSDKENFKHLKGQGVILEKNLETFKDYMLKYGTKELKVKLST